MKRIRHRCVSFSLHHASIDPQATKKKGKTNGKKNVNYRVLEQIIRTQQMKTGIMIKSVEFLNRHQTDRPDKTEQTDAAVELSFSCRRFRYRQTNKKRSCIVETIKRGRLKPGQGIAGLT